MLVTFVAAEIALQLIQVLFDLGPLRVLERVATFGASLALLFLLPGKGRAHPSRVSLYGVIAVLLLNLFSPEGNTLVARFAQIALYVAILAPTFWVGRLQIDGRVFRTVMLMFWGFHVASSVAGMLQVLYPGRFQPALSPLLAARDHGYLESLTIKLASGARVFRPMGLTDIPGGAALSGFYTVLLGGAFFLLAKRWLIRGFCSVAMTAGIACIFLSQVRIVLIYVILTFGVVLGLFAIAGQVRRLTSLGILAVCLAVAGVGLAVTAGGERIMDRFDTLLNAPVGDVYYKNRGIFLESTIQDLLPTYPLGAGLGRWGMMNAYFGDNSHPETGAIWVEIQWTGWLLDGGLPLILFYAVALFICIRTSWRIARRHLGKGPPDLGVWSAVLTAYNIGSIVVTFDYPLFVSQAGLEFWLFNAMLWLLANRAAAGEPLA